jgi:hypothetical protein
MEESVWHRGEKKKNTQERKRRREKNERKDINTCIRRGKGRKAEKRNLLGEHRFFCLLFLSLFHITSIYFAFTVDGIVHHHHR